MIQFVASLVTVLLALNDSVNDKLLIRNLQKRAKVGMTNFLYT